MALEIEIKFLSIDPDDLRVRLKQAGYVCTRPWSRMRRYTFMLSELNPNPGKWARVRDEGNGRVAMAFKQETDNQRIDGLEEIEFTVSSFEDAVAFMQKLGFEHWAYQESDREAWHKGAVEVTLNQWPVIPVFTEIEGPSEASVREACRELGFDFNDGIFGGIGRLYELQTTIAANTINSVRELTFARSYDFNVI